MVGDWSLSSGIIRNACDELIEEVHRLRSVTLCGEIQKRDATIAEQVSRIYELERRIAEVEKEIRNVQH